MLDVRSRDVALAASAFIAIGLLWEFYVRLMDVPSFILPTPTAVIVELFARSDLYLKHAWVTFYETVLGFFFAAVLGMVVAILIVYSRLLQTVLYPLVVVLQIIPKVAIAPLLLIWVGFGVQSKVILALLIAFFPVVVDTVTGLRAVDDELVDLVRVLKGSRWQEFRKIRLPYASPFIFAGLKVAITLAVIGAIIGEFVGGNRGLGYLIVIANVELNVAMSFAALVTLSVMGLLLFAAVALAERITIPWAAHESGENTVRHVGA